ncbi:hypothetical protein ACFY36_15940 [Actinoplanes sp. NPDC000266]
MGNSAPAGSGRLRMTTLVDRHEERAAIGRLGRYPEVLRAIESNGDFSDPTISTWVLPELVEAAVRVGDSELALDALARLVTETEPFGTGFARGIEARCRALLAEGTVAAELYTEAIEKLGRTGLRPELARAHLLYGEWLRRERRGVDARDHLRRTTCSSRSGWRRSPGARGRR